ncbi:MAG: NADH-quinone oxidoreductase subunit J, partial [Cyclobacteriaceae bacterium]
MVITSYNMIHALIYLVVSFLAIAVVFFVLGAPFIAALEIIIY